MVILLTSLTRVKINGCDFSLRQKMIQLGNYFTPAKKVQKLQNTKIFINL